MKPIACIAVLLLLAAWLPAQSITVTSPKGGETWPLGGSRTVTWTYKGLAGNSQVRLILYQGDVKKGVMIAGTAIGANGSGSWTWSDVGGTAAGKAPAGSGYRIRIRDLQDKCPVAISNAFTLGDLSNLQPIAAREIGNKFFAAGAIPVSMPAQGLQIKPGSMLEIKWDRTPIATYPQVKFGVYLSDRKTYVGSVHRFNDPLQVNDGDYQDALIFNERYQVGKEYVIRVATPDENYVGFSGVFRVQPLDAVPLTETFTGSGSRVYPKIVQWESPVIGCLYTKGEAPTWPQLGFAVGWSNTMDDPSGPCWKYIGHVYRTIVNPTGIYKGFEVTKAVLRFSVVSFAKKQPFYLLRRDGAGDGLDVPATPLATINWEFGHTVEIDITPTVQAWCTGQAPNHGLIIRGGDEGFAHNNDNALCAISSPEIVITRIQYQ